MKVGRNDSCPCGSGKKYKKCCLAQEAQIEVGDLLWRQLRSIHDEMASTLVQHAKKRFGEDALADAWDEFWSWEEKEETDDGFENQLFVPYFIYNWLPDIESRTYSVAPKETTVGCDYRDTKGKSLSPLERNFLEQCLWQPFSFHEVTEINPGEGFRLKDIFLGTEHDVVEKSGSQRAKVGDIFYAKVIQIEHVGMICGCGWIIIPPIQKKAIIDLRKKLQKSKQVKGGVITSDDLLDFDIELRELFLNLHDQLTAPLTLCNTDDELMSFHKITYEIDSAQIAFDALKSLCQAETEEELLRYGAYDTSGHLSEVEFSWLKEGNKIHEKWETTIMGHIIINGKKLTVEVNSENRAKQIKKEITKRLKEKAVHKSTVFQSPETMLREHRQSPNPEADRRREEEQQTLMQHPEIQEKLKEMAKKHWENWYHQKIPALGNKTPLQAAKSTDGKELLHALLNHYRRSDSPSNAFSPPNWNEIQVRLGLTEGN